MMKGDKCDRCTQHPIFIFRTFFTTRRNVAKLSAAALISCLRDQGPRRFSLGCCVHEESVPQHASLFRGRPCPTQGWFRYHHGRPEDQHQCCLCSLRRGIVSDDSLPYVAGSSKYKLRQYDLLLVLNSSAGDIHSCQAGCFKELKTSSSRSLPSPRLG